MEDRVVSGLWIEMTDMAERAYVEEVVPQTTAREGVGQVIWFANVQRDRVDLPRHLPEFDLLALYEIDEHFRPPEPRHDISGMHFVRTPRPPQGRLTDRPTAGISFVLISPREPHQAQALRDWGDFVHISEIAAAAVPGITTITPFENADGGDPRFLHLYEMDSDDPEAVFKAMTPAVTDRLGGRGTPQWQHWATCPELRIMYVNSFRALGRSES